MTSYIGKFIRYVYGEDKLAKRDEEITRLTQLLSQREAELARKDIELDQKNAELVRKNAELDQKNAELLQVLLKRYKEAYNVELVISFATSAAFDLLGKVEKTKKEITAVEKTLKNAMVADKMYLLIENEVISVSHAWSVAYHAYKEAARAYNEAGGRETPYNKANMVETVDPFKCKEGEMTTWEWRGQKFIRDYNNFVWQAFYGRSKRSLNGKRKGWIKGSFVGLYIFAMDWIDQRAEEPVYETVFHDYK